MINENIFIRFLGLSARNLLFSSLSSPTATATCLSKPKLRISIGSFWSEVVLYDVTSAEETCNPNWTFSSVSEESMNLAKTHSSEQTMKLRVFEVNADSGKENCIIETQIILSQLRFLGTARLQKLGTLPINSIFFVSENGMFVSEELFQQLTRAGIPVTAEQYCRDAEDDERVLSLSSEISSSENLLEQLRAQAMEAVQGVSSSCALSAELVAKQAAYDSLLLDLEAVNSELNFETIRARKDEQLLQQFTSTEAKLSKCLEMQKEIVTLTSNCRTIREDNTRIKFLFEVRQLKLISELQAIYPIEKANGGEYAIRGLEFPADHTTVDDEHIAAVLGYLAHLLVLLAKYLDAPLRYPIAYACSRSLIRDPMLAGSVSTAGAGQAATLPLYRKGVDRDKFERSLVLLQRNVEYIVQASGVEYQAKKSFLFNLNELFMHQICPNMEI